MITPEQANEKIDCGWMRVLIIFEALAINEEVVRSSLEDLIGKMDKDDKCKIYKKQFSKCEKRDKPLKGIEVAYSVTAEIEIVVKRLDDLAELIIEYGPSVIQLLEPSKMEVTAAEVQNVLSRVSQMMHEFAAAGVGGLVLVRKSMEQK